MIYIMLIGVICLAEFVIRHHINKKFTDSERKSIGKGHITLRKYHNAGMANDTLEKRPALVKGIGVGVVSLITVTFVLARAFNFVERKLKRSEGKVTSRA